MKNINANLLTSTTNTYDKTKTTLAGNATVHSVSGVTAIGPALTKFIDVQTDFAGLVAQSGVHSATINGRMFVLSTFAASVASIALYNVDYVTGAESPVGRILITLPSQAATTHTARFIRAIDTGTTGWKILVGTIGTVAVNGGVFLVNNVDLADFSMGPSPTQFYMAVANNTKGVYQLQDPAGLGAANNITALMGGTYNSTIQQAIVTTGTAGSFAMHGFDVSINPNVLIQAATAPTVAASPTFTLTGHGYAANDMLVFTANTPTPFVTSTGANVQTVYFVRATNLTANTFELSATAGGVAINATSATTPTFARAHGASSNTYLASRKTGTITSGFAGTALLVDCQKIVTIADGPNGGSLCYFFPTTTNFYCFKVTDITSGVTTLPTAAGINNLGSGTDITAPTTINATYSETLGKIIYVSAAFSFIMKNWANNAIITTFGTQINTWLENTGRIADYFRGFAVSGVDIRQGVMFVSGVTVGQRGMLMIDLRSDAKFDYSYVISPVLNVGNSIFKFITTIETLFVQTDTLEISYRTASTLTDPMFNTAAGSWTLLNSNSDLSGISLLNYAQFKINWDVATVLSGIPSQIIDLVIGIQPRSEMSDNWLGSVDNTSQNGATPAYSAFRLITAYSTSVPQMFFRAYDDNNVLVASANTTSDPTLFEYSTNNGTSWNALGTIPNTIQTTEVRYKWPTPPGVKVIVSFRES